MFRVLVLFEHAPDHGAGARPNALPPANQALRRPLPVGSMGRRHLGRNRAVSTGPGVIGMAGNTLATMQNLDRRRGVACLKFESDQRMRNAVAMQVELDVVVNVRLDLLEARNFIALGW